MSSVIFETGLVFNVDGGLRPSCESYLVITSEFSGVRAAVCGGHLFFSCLSKFYDACVHKPCNRTLTVLRA